MQSSLRVVSGSFMAARARPVCHEAVPRRILCQSTGTFSASGRSKSELEVEADQEFLGQIFVQCGYVGVAG